MSTSLCLISVKVKRNNLTSKYFLLNKLAIVGGIDCIKVQFGILYYSPLMNDLLQQASEKTVATFGTTGRYRI